MGKREQAWEYFRQHSEQRMQLFNFYITITTAIFGGIAAITYNKLDNSLIVSLLEILPIVITAVFWMLDSRTRYLIRHAEVFIKKIEMEDKDNVINIFSEESTNGLVSYTVSMRIMYVTVIIISIIILLSNISC